MKIKLISPEVRTNFSGWFKRFLLFPRLSLPVIAAATPSIHEVVIEDESFSPININQPVDVVGISVFTAAAKRAYEIADLYRGKGVKVILGGIHPTAMPNEALLHADAIVKGEAELVWPQILNDIANDSLKRIYSKPLKDMKSYNFPQRNLFEKKGLLINTIEASRGCPNSCNFCSVAKFHSDPKYKTRDIDNILLEIDQLKTKFLFFVDDNLVGNKSFAKELFKEISHLNIKWFSQLSIDIAKDKDLLDVFSKSGLIGAYIGFDSIRKSNLNESVKKKADYIESVKKIRDYGIGIQGSFIFGFEKDDISVFDDTLEFLEKTKIELAYFHVLTPYPGTKLFSSMQDRIFTFDWDRYNSTELVFDHPNMSYDSFMDKYWNVWDEFYSIKLINRIANSNHKIYSALANISHFLRKKEVYKKISERKSTKDHR